MVLMTSEIYTWEAANPERAAGAALLFVDDAAAPVEVDVPEAPPVLLLAVRPVGHELIVAVAYCPFTVVLEQEDVPDGDAIFGAFQDGGSTPFRRSAAVTNFANDQVKSLADIWVPLSLLNCSDRAPLDGVYFWTTETKPSAYVLTAFVRDLYVSVELA